MKEEIKEQIKVVMDRGGLTYKQAKVAVRFIRRVHNSIPRGAVVREFSQTEVQAACHLFAEAGFEITPDDFRLCLDMRNDVLANELARREEDAGDEWNSSP